MAFNHNLIKKYKALRLARTFLTWLILYYLRTFAQIALIFFRGKAIGIAGAVGKSTTRNALAAILTCKRTLVISGNSETGIPLGLLGLDIKSYRLWDFIRVMVLAPFRIGHVAMYQCIIVEMGIDGPNPPKNMNYLLTIIQPEIGILINESPAHVANYEKLMGEGSIEDRLGQIVTFMTEDDGKLLTTSHLTTAIINADDPNITRFAKKLPRQIIRTVGTDRSCDISLYHHEITDQGTTFEFAVHTFQENQDVILKFPKMVLPEETSTSIGAAILGGLAIGIELSTISQHLTKYFYLPKGRGTIIQGIRDATIFDSSYNASSASVISFLRVMKQFTQKTRRPTWFVFGDMKELGSFTAYEHGQVAKYIPDHVDHLLLVGPLTKQLVLSKLPSTKFKTLIHVDTSLQAGSYLKTHLPPKAIVLFKGSQLLEEGIKYILKDKQDRKKLCRQDEFWKSAKKKNGTWVEA